MMPQGLLSVIVVLADYKRRPFPKPAVVLKSSSSALFSKEKSLDSSSDSSEPGGGMTIFDSPGF
jgi:hypothetical protein